MSAGHVDAFAAAADRASPAGRAALVDQQQSLAGRAAAQSPEEFGVACRRIVALADDDGGVGEFERQRRATRLRRWIDDGTGMFRLAGEFDPELGVRLWRAIDHAIASNYPAGQHPDSTPDGPDAHDHLAALALADLATAAFTDPTTDPTPATATPASATPADSPPAGAAPSDPAPTGTDSSADPAPATDASTAAPPRADQPTTTPRSAGSARAPLAVACCGGRRGASSASSSTSTP